MLVHIFLRAIFHPFKYETFTMHGADDILIVCNGPKKDIATLKKLMYMRHQRYLQNSVVDKK